MRFPILFVGMLGLLLACNNATEASQNEKIAKVYCDCTAALAPLNQKAATQASDSIGQAAFYALLQQIQQENAKAKECLITITAQYGKLPPDAFADIEKILARQCPAMAANGELLREMLGE